jgi:serine/threonine-protein kinase HipA
MRQAQVYHKNRLAGEIRETDEAFIFQYNAEYLATADSKPVSLTLPLQQKEFTSKILFPFFDGLIPEGWLLNIASESWKITKNDRMGLLLACCQNAIGAVSVHPLNSKSHE